MAEFVDHYRVMRVGLFATEHEIKRSYMSLSKMYHPDKNKSPDATATFQSIGQSYFVLKDKQRRAAYDQERKQNALDKFRSWKSKELVARNERNDKWMRWSEDCLEEIRMRLASFNGQRNERDRLDEEAKAEIDSFEEVGNDGGQFRNSVEAFEAMLDNPFFQALFAEKKEVAEQLEYIQGQIRLLMNSFQDQQFEYKRTEHMALLAVAGKTLAALDNYEIISDRSPSSVQESKDRWRELQRSEGPVYEMYDQALDMLNSCVAPCQHRLRLDYGDRKPRLLCARCKKGIPVWNAVHKCEGCGLYMCSACNERLKQLTDYHSWLEDVGSDRLFGV
ncbi:hypothetical protein VTL71DRAFT_13681 [Oculimacula yallundae]|uniref:J domain-containing protein n=1 Tax=Oculimacula yallundae TaxID=86028 RepID=A0ABR4CL30_9HELO